MYFTNEINELKKEGLSCIDPHCHSCISDGSYKPEDMVKYAAKHNFKIIVTDHNEIGAIKRIKRYTDFLIPAIEITTNSSKDILFYFYSLNDLQEFYDKCVKGYENNNNGFNLHCVTWDEATVIEKALEYNAKIVVPHPYSYRPKRCAEFFLENKHLLKHVDCVENFCGVLSYQRNKLAQEWAKKVGKPTTVGSDAHTLMHLGLAMVVTEHTDTHSFLDNLGKNKVLCKRISPISRILSDLIIFKNNLRFRFDNK